MQTLQDLWPHLAALPDRSVTAYNRRGRPSDLRSLPTLARRSRAIGAALLAQDIAPGSLLFLQLVNGHQLLECFLGALSVGIVPCCLAPPRALGGLEVFRDRLAKLMATFSGGLLLALAETGDASGLPFILPPEIDDDSPEAPVIEVAPESLAFIQLTSGSTTTPKAVQISHRAAVANTAAIASGSGGQIDEACVCWLPMYHDMGLVGLVLTSLVLGIDLHLMQPESFVARPKTWLDVISGLEQSVGTTAPNFAYQHCVNKISAEDAAALDLSRWRVAGCGAERVRPQTLEDFARHFAPAGFSADAFVPCYGMAETTLAITFHASGSAPQIDDGHVSCGPPIVDTEVVIRDPQGRPVEDSNQGEITVRGPGLFSGYCGASSESGLRDGWFYTGDRGYLKGGELYITGRFKDLMIIDGTNLDPDEVEQVGESVTRTPAGRSGAFSIEVDRREQVVLVVEVERAEPETLEDFASEIGDWVASMFGFTLHDLLFVKRGTLPTTSSGKVKRAQLCEMYLDGQIDAIHSQKQKGPS